MRRGCWQGVQNFGDALALALVPLSWSLGLGLPPVLISSGQTADSDTSAVTETRLIRSIRDFSPALWSPDLDTIIALASCVEECCAGVPSGDIELSEIGLQDKTQLNNNHNVSRHHPPTVMLQSAPVFTPHWHGAQWPNTELAHSRTTLGHQPAGIINTLPYREGSSQKLLLQFHCNVLFYTVLYCTKVI